MVRLNIWRDRAGKLHAEFYRWRMSMDHQILPTFAALDRWLKEWWPVMQAPS